MSVCYYNPPKFHDVRTLTARKPHTCCECGFEIKPKESYEKATTLHGEVFTTYKTCSICIEIWKFLTTNEIIDDSEHDELYEILYRFLEEGQNVRGPTCEIATTVHWLRRGVGGRFNLQK